MPSPQTGSLYWMGKILREPDLDPTDKVILMGLADHVNADDECWVSRTTLASFAGCSERTVTRRLSSLCENRYLSAVPRKGTTNLYRLIRADLPDPGQSVTPDTAMTTPPGQAGDYTPGHPGVSRSTQEVPNEVTSLPLDLPAEAPRKAKPRQRDPIWDALEHACQFSGTDLTPSEASDVGKTVRELKSVGATPADIADRASLFRQTYPQATLTHRALRNNWTSLETPESSATKERALFDLYVEAEDTHGEGSPESIKVYQRIKAMGNDTQAHFFAHLSRINETRQQTGAKP